VAGAGLFIMMQIVFLAATIQNINRMLYDETKPNLDSPQQSSQLTMNTAIKKNPKLLYPPGRKYVKPILEPILGKHRPNADAVFVVATGYGLDIFLTLVGSLLKTGYEGDIVLGIDELNTISPDLKSYLAYHSKHSHVICYDMGKHCFKTKGGLLQCNMDFAYKDPIIGEPVPDLSGRPRPIRKFRFENFWIWSQNYDPRSRILLVDSRDSYFQSNPFQHRTLPENMESELQLFAEKSTNLLKVSNMPFIEKLYGFYYAKSISKNYGSFPTLCAGTTLGGKAAMEQYLLLMIYEIDNIAGHELQIGDQAHHNILYYTGQLKNQEGIDKVTVFRNYKGVVGTIGGTPHQGMRLVNDTMVMNLDGRLTPVVHQFDRSEKLNKLVQQRVEEWRQEAQKYLNQQEESVVSSK
jgi:hypothetical protein